MSTVYGGEQAREWLASNYGCGVRDLSADSARLYRTGEGDSFQLLAMGGGPVAAAGGRVYERAAAFLREHPVSAAELPLFELEERCLRPFGLKLSECVRYLYTGEGEQLSLPPGFTCRLTERGPELDALASDRRFRNALGGGDIDVLARGAYVDGRPVSLAGADDRSGSLWQMGVDTLPDYRHRGLSAALTRQLAEDILERGAIPYYTTWTRNLYSARTALKSGFVPCWVEYEAVPVNKPEKE